MTASFKGFENIVKALLGHNGIDINLQNKVSDFVILETESWRMVYGTVERVTTVLSLRLTMPRGDHHLHSFRFNPLLLVQVNWPQHPNESQQSSINPWKGLRVVFFWFFTPAHYTHRSLLVLTHSRNLLIRSILNLGSFYGLCLWLLRLKCFLRKMAFT